MPLDARFVKAAKKRAWGAARKIGATPDRVTRLIGKNRLDKEVAACLNVMRRDNLASPQPFRASPIWIDLATRFDDWFALEGIADVEHQEMNGFFSSPFPNNPKLLRYASWLLYRDLKARDYAKLLTKAPATASVESGLAFDFEGHRISWDQLISIDTLYTMAEVDPRILTEPLIVADLGSGWGRLGYVLKKANPGATYVVMDLPEGLLVSQTHLPRRLPEASVVNYLASRGMSLSRSTLGGGKCVFLGAHDLARVEDNTIDFFVNIASFQEMTAHQVGLYFQHISRVGSGFLYLQQLWDAGTHSYGVGEISGWDTYPFPASWQSVVKRNARWSDLYFEAVLKL
jgi:putative sugar O-methyltransferase